MKSNMFRDNLCLTVFGVLTLGVCGVVGLFALVALGTATYGRMACTEFGERSRLPVAYTFASGCLVQLGNDWVSASQTMPVLEGFRIIYVPRPVIDIGAPRK